MAKNNFITIKEASLVLSVTRATLRNWDQAGKLKAYRHPFNNYRIYKVEDIENVLEMMDIDPAIIKRKREQIKKISIKHLED